MSFRPTLAVFRGGKSTSSKNWLSRQSGDVYTRKRLESADNWRSRSAFKLLELNEKYDNFLRKPHVRSVVDLGAAPGGWSQVVARLNGHSLDRSVSAEQYGLSWQPGDVDESSELDKTNEDTSQSASSATKGEHNGKARRGVAIIAVDMLRMQPIPGVHSLQMDFLSSEADSTVSALLKTDGNTQGKVDVIMSDMMANMSGNSIRDIEASLDICQAVWQFASRHLRTAKNIGHPRGGVMLIKHFQHQRLQEFRDEYLKPHFRSVLYIKPNASRSDSSEGYWLCLGFRMAKGKDCEKP